MNEPISRLKDPYHVGLVVEELEAGMVHVGALLNMRWAAPFRANLRVRLGDGDLRVLEFAAVYSRGGPFQLELCQAIPGTLWAAGDGWHHVGFWSEDLARDSSELAAVGYPAEARHEPDDGRPEMFAYHRGPQGSYIELVSSLAVRPRT